MNNDCKVKLLNEKVKGEVEQKDIEGYSKINANPLFKNLGIGYKDSLNNSMLLNLNVNNTQITSGNDKDKLKGISYDSGMPLSTKYPSINYNRFGYLFNFTQGKDNKLHPGQIKPSPLPHNSKTEIPEEMFEEPEVPTIQQIINNPCIFNIREKLMKGKMNKNYNPTPSQSTTNKENSHGHHRNFSLKVETKRNKNR